MANLIKIWHDRSGSDSPRHPWLIFWTLIKKKKKIMTPIFPTGINSTLGRKLQITLLSVSNTWFILLQLFTTYDALICKSGKICVVSFYYDVNENICFHKLGFQIHTNSVQSSRACVCMHAPVSKNSMEEIIQLFSARSTVMAN